MFVLMNHCRGDLKMSHLLQFSHRGPTDGMAPQSFTLLSIMLCAVHVHSLCWLQGALVEKVNGLAENMVTYTTFKRYRVDTSRDAGKSKCTSKWLVCFREALFHSAVLIKTV